MPKKLGFPPLSSLTTTPSDSAFARFYRSPDCYSLWKLVDRSLGSRTSKKLPIPMQFDSAIQMPPNPKSNALGLRLCFGSSGTLFFFGSPRLSKCQPFHFQLASVHGGAGALGAERRALRPRTTRRTGSQQTQQLGA
jgi:hypothetical protein